MDDNDKNEQFEITYKAILLEQMEREIYFNNEYYPNNPEIFETKHKKYDSSIFSDPLMIELRQYLTTSMLDVMTDPKIRKKI